MAASLSIYNLSDLPVALGVIFSHMFCHLCIGMMQLQSEVRSKGKRNKNLVRTNPILFSPLNPPTLITFSKHLISLPFQTIEIKNNNNRQNLGFRFPCVVPGFLMSPTPEPEEIFCCQLISPCLVPFHFTVNKLVNGELSVSAPGRSSKLHKSRFSVPHLVLRGGIRVFDCVLGENCYLISFPFN